jgi:hypothetical protein
MCIYMYIRPYVLQLRSIRKRTRYHIVQEKKTNNDTTVDTRTKEHKNNDKNNDITVDTRTKEHNIEQQVRSTNRVRRKVRRSTSHNDETLQSYSYSVWQKL